MSTVFLLVQSTQENETPLEHLHTWPRRLQLVADEIYYPGCKSSYAYEDVMLFPHTDGVHPICTCANVNNENKANLNPYEFDNSVRPHRM